MGGGDDECPRQNHFQLAHLISYDMLNGNMGPFYLKVLSFVLHLPISNYTRAFKPGTNPKAVNYTFFRTCFWDQPKLVR